MRRLMMGRLTMRRLTLAGAMLLGLVHAAQAGTALDAIRQRHGLRCGVNVGAPDFSKADTNGGLSAFSRDICRALAAAIMGEAAQATVVSFDDEPTAMRALAAGRVDIVAAATPSLTNRTAFAASFGPPVLVTGQGFLVPRAAGIARIADLAGQQVCFLGGTVAEAVLDAEAPRRHLAVIRTPFEETGEMQAALVTGHCAAIMNDLTTLADARAGFHGQAADYVILDETLTTEALAPAIRTGDAGWAAVVDATVSALLRAEELGMTQASADAKGMSALAPSSGGALGLAPDWALWAVRAAGNYGELFERDLGARSPLRLRRGPNRPASQGGLLLASLFR